MNLMFHIDLSLDDNFCLHNKFLYTIFCPITCGRNPLHEKYFSLLFYFRPGILRSKQGKKVEKRKTLQHSIAVVFLNCCYFGLLECWLHSRFPLHAHVNHLSLSSLHRTLFTLNNLMQRITFVWFAVKFWRIQLHLPPETPANSV